MCYTDISLEASRIRNCIKLCFDNELAGGQEDHLLIAHLILSPSPLPGCSMPSLHLSFLICLPDFHLPIQKSSTLGNDEVSCRENPKGHFEQGADQQGFVLL